MRLMHVIGTRPNFVKQAPIISAAKERIPGVDQHVVHTGQHYDRMMSEIFFDELGVPAPDHLLEVGSGTHAAQTARVMERLEPVIAETAPDIVLVPGDVNSTLAAAVTATKMGVPVAHVEAGLRSFDRSMPEEVNRVLVDQVSDLLFTHSPEALENLSREGVDEARVHLVGNTMIDTLVALAPRIEAADAAGRLGFQRGSCLLVTLHRPALVDGPLLARTIANLESVASDLPVLFPVHPRTRARIESEGIPVEKITMIDPVGYLDFLSLIGSAAAVLTDSGGIQEETTYLGVPCFTLRDNTERPITIDAGTNTLIGLDPDAILQIPAKLGSGRPGDHTPPPLWDGHAAERLVDILAAA